MTTMIAGKTAGKAESLRRRLWALLLAATALLAAFPATADDAPPLADPAPGELLIALEAIQDPRFYHSVVLVVRHDSTGAFGIVINNPIAERPIAALLTESKDGTDE